MKKYAFALHGLIPSQGKFNWPYNMASEGRSVSQICVINLSPGSAVTSTIVGERIFSIPHSVWADC